MTMRIGAVTLAYNDEVTIAGTINCLKPFVDQHVVLISEKPYFGEAAPPDRTEDICHGLGVDVVKGFWELDHGQRTLGNQICKECDWVLGFDSDEMMEADELEKFIKFLSETTYPAVAIRPEVYWRTTDYRLSPKADYAPIVAMRPEVKFTHIRNIDSPWTIYDGVMHHLSWCEPKDIRKKVLNYAHATDFEDAELWYDSIYEPWTFKYDKIAVMPDGTKFTVEKNPLPDELKRYIS